jgi:hypothetical protein
VLAAVVPPPSSADSPIRNENNLLRFHTLLALEMTVCALIRQGTDRISDICLLAPDLEGDRLCLTRAARGMRAPRQSIRAHRKRAPAGAAREPQRVCASRICVREAPELLVESAVLRAFLQMLGRRAAPAVSLDPARLSVRRRMSWSLPASRCRPQTYP